MAVEKAIGSSSLVEVIDRILDKGIVVDAWVRVSLVGIEILAIEARVVAASVETYLKYAEAIGLPQQQRNYGPNQHIEDSCQAILMHHLGGAESMVRQEKPLLKMEMMQSCF